MKDLLKLETVKDNLEYLKRFIYDLEICISNIQQVIDAQNNKVFLKPIEGFIGHYIFLCYSNCAINAYKIFSKKEKRGFSKLFNKIETCSYDSELTQLLKTNQGKLDSSNLIKTKKELVKKVAGIRKAILDNSELINKINLRRSKFYAHSDPSSKNTKPETLKEIEKLKDFAIEIYQDLNGSLFDNHYMFSINNSTIEPVINDRIFVDDYYRLEEEKLKL